MMMRVGFNIANGNVGCSSEQLENYQGEMMSRGVTHTVRLDDLWRGGPQMDVLKIDVEGFEPHVMAGTGGLQTQAVASSEP